MEKVLGLGGVFIRTKDPNALAAWYRDQLGIDVPPTDYETPIWTSDGGPCLVAPFAADTEYFGRPEQAFMLNFRVRDLEAMSRQLEAAGVPVKPDPTSPHPNGSFAWVHDPEGNRIELWEPSGTF
ncbi:MAG: VOC family protein [Pseudomonadota bacterium]